MTELDMSLGELIEALKAGEGGKIDLNTPLKGGVMALGQVSSVEYITLMLENGADPNVTDSRGTHSLVNVMTRYTGNDNRDVAAEIARLMIAHGMDVNQENEGRSLLTEAAYYDLPELAVVLLENGADPAGAQCAIALGQEAGAMDTVLAICDFLGISADDYADDARMTMEDLFSWFTDPEPSIASRDGIGHTPLHLAAEFGASHLFEELLDMGADVNARNNHGRTPLFMALNSDLDEDTIVTTIKTLADMGADLSAKDDAGRSLAQYAREVRGPKGVMAILDEAAGE